jgi:hypothetical protein
MAENSIIKYENIIGADDTFKIIDKHLDELEARVIKLAKTLDGQFSLVNPNDTKQIEAYEKKVRELEQAVINLTKQREVATKAQKQEMQQTQEQLVQIETNKIKRREQIAIAKQEAILATSQKGSIAALRAELSLVTLEWKKLTAAETTDLQKGKELTAQKLQLTQQLKQLEKATGDHRREVGNYTLAGNKAASMVSRLGIAGNKLTGVFGRAGRALDSIGFGAFALAAAAATIAWQFFADNIIGNSDEIIEKNKELKDSISGLTTDLKNIQREGKLLQIDNSNLSEAEKRLKKIGLLQFDLGKAQSDLNASANEASELDSKIRLNSFKTELEKNEAIARALELDIERAKLAQSVIEAGKEINKIQEDGNKASEEAAKKRQEEIKKELEARKKLESEISKLQSDRLKAIQELQDQITQLETENIKDRQEKLLALEDLKTKEENRLREENFLKIVELQEQQEAKLIELYGQNSKEVLAFRAKTNQDLLSLETANYKLSEEQLKASEQRKIEIRKEFALSTEEIQPINVLKQQSKEEAALLNEQVALVEETNDKKKESYEDLFNSISETTQKIGQLINESFEKQADLAKENVDKQVSAVEDARERARLGLENNLKFEQEQLAKREAEQQRAQKRAQQAAKLTALFNIVAAAAASGDKDAVINGIVQFGLLEAFSAAIEGSFYEGTEDLGKANNPLDSKGGRLIMAHDNERILTKRQNMALGGALMDNNELVENALLGQRMKDLAPNLIGAEHYAAQANSLTGSHKSDSNQDIKRLESMMNEVRKAIVNKPTNSDDLVKVTATSFEVSRKVVQGAMTREQKIKKYL